MQKKICISQKLGVFLHCEEEPRKWERKLYNFLKHFRCFHFKNCNILKETICGENVDSYENSLQRRILMTFFCYKVT